MVFAVRAGESKAKPSGGKTSGVSDGDCLFAEIGVHPFLQPAIIHSSAMAALLGRALFARRQNGLYIYIAMVNLQSFRSPIEDAGCCYAVGGDQLARPNLGKPETRMERLDCRRLPATSLSVPKSFGFIVYSSSGRTLTCPSNLPAALETLFHTSVPKRTAQTAEFCALASTRIDDKPERRNPNREKILHASSNDLTIVVTPFKAIIDGRHIEGFLLGPNTLIFRIPSHLAEHHWQLDCGVGNECEGSDVAGPYHETQLTPCGDWRDNLRLILGKGPTPNARSVLAEHPSLVASNLPRENCLLVRRRRISLLEEIPRYMARRGSRSLDNQREPISEDDAEYIPVISCQRRWCKAVIDYLVKLPLDLGAVKPTRPRVFHRRDSRTRHWRFLDGSLAPPLHRYPGSWIGWQNPTLPVLDRFPAHRHFSGPILTILATLMPFSIRCRGYHSYCSTLRDVQMRRRYSLCIQPGPVVPTLLPERSRRVFYRLREAVNDSHDRDR
ncbi:hypothetical protein C8J56DRAFT_1069162 [Mycena floridula]|nr:hypothetical protein C8J56DRAFT_1069162 [Mycena floridula]